MFVGEFIISYGDYRCKLNHRFVEWISLEDMPPTVIWDVFYEYHREHSNKLRVGYTTKKAKEFVTGFFKTAYPKTREHLIPNKNVKVDTECVSIMVNLFDGTAKYSNDSGCTEYMPFDLLNDLFEMQ